MNDMVEKERDAFLRKPTSLDDTRQATESQARAHAVFGTCMHANGTPAIRVAGAMLLHDCQ